MLRFAVMTLQYISRCALLIVITTSFVPAFSQDASVIPGELKLLQGPINDTDRARTYNWICFNYAYENPEEGIRFGRMGLELSKKIPFEKGIGDAHSNMGFCFTCMNAFDSARVQYEQAVTAFRGTENNCWTKVPIANLGANYFEQKNYSLALEKYLESMRLEEGCEDRGFKSTGIYSVGIVYNAMQKFDLAIPYFEKALQIDISNGDSAKMAERYNALGNAYTGLGKIEQARTHFNKSIEITENLGHNYVLAFAHLGLSRMEEKDGNRTQSILLAEKALAEFRELERPADCLGTGVFLGKQYTQQNNLKAAESVLRECVQWSEGLKVSPDRLKSFELLSLVLLKTGNSTEAGIYFEKYLGLKDSVDARGMNDKLADYSTKYETEKKEKELLLEKQKTLDQEIAIQEQQFQKRIFLFLGVVFFLLALILINRYRLKQRIAKELEEKNVLIAKEKNRAEESERFKQQFLANMSHEMRTPVSVISGLSTLLSQQSLDITSKKYVDAIHHSSENLVSLVNDVLDLSKMEEGKMQLRLEPFSLNREIKLLTESFLPQVKSKNVRLQTEIDEDLHDQFIGDVRRIRQILYNLISNAIKFTDTGSVIVNVRSGGQKNKDKIIIIFEIKDTGIGIPSDQIARIFENYIQTGSKDRGGTGLGLGIARQLTTLMDGKIEVKSELGKGSSFSVYLPLTPVSKGQIQNMTIDQHFKNELQIRFVGKPILITDDYDYNRMLASESLRSWFNNLRIEEAKSGIEAIEKIKEKEFAFVLMDLRMQPMDGIEATKIIRQFSEVPIIALTASALESDLDACLSAGMNEVVLKPFRESDLIGAISKVFGLELSINEAENTSQIHSQWPYLHSLCSGDQIKLKKYLTIAIEELPLLLKEIDMAIEHQNPAVVKQSIHRSISYLACLELTQEMQKAAHFDKTDAIDLLKEFDELKDWVKSVRTGIQNAITHLEMTS